MSAFAQFWKTTALMVERCTANERDRLRLSYVIAHFMRFSVVIGALTDAFNQRLRMPKRVLTGLKVVQLRKTSQAYCNDIELEILLDF